MFPVIAPNLIHPLSRNDFDLEVLIPECATALIEQDLGVETNEALIVLRKSSRYGTEMFPNDN